MEGGGALDSKNIAPDWTAPAATRSREHAESRLRTVRSGRRSPGLTRSKLPRPSSTVTGSQRADPGRDPAVTESGLIGVYLTIMVD